MSTRNTDDYFIDRALGAYHEMDRPVYEVSESTGTLIIAYTLYWLLWLGGIYLLVQFVKWAWQS